MSKLLITIDGPAASGKSSAASGLAERLGASFLDTGAMYRAVTLAAMQDKADLNDELQLLDVLQSHAFEFSFEKDRLSVSIDRIDVTEQIRSKEVTEKARYIASAAGVREKLVEMQRRFAADKKIIVTEGRDQGTVVFPDADIKFYLTADTHERARRRQTQLQAQGGGESLEQIRDAIEQRDKTDESRTVGPLKPARDSIVIDTTDLTLIQVIEKLRDLVAQKCPEKRPRMIWFRFARFVCKVFCIAFFRMRVYGKENVPAEGPVLLVCNHQSFLDPVFCGIHLKRPLYFLARDTLYSNRFFGRLILSVNTIPVRRGKADLSAIKKTVGKLEQGYGVCLFPEATRTNNGKIASFKGGFGLLCRRAEAAVVPVLIDGAFECWPRHKKIFSPRSEITIRYGKCITSEQVKQMDERQLAKSLTDTLRRMQNECRIERRKETYDYTIQDSTDNCST